MQLFLKKKKKGKTGLYSKQVSHCVSHTQFQVSQFSEFEHEKDFTVFRVWGGLGQSRGGGSQRGELTQQVQAGAGTWSHATRAFGVPPLLNGASTTSTADATRKAKACTSALDQALELLPFLGLLGPVCNVAHPALAP